jgi:hypothetical protein
MTGSDTKMRRIEGACYCGNIRFAFELPEPEGAIPVRACGCSFCRKHGAVYSSHPAGRLAARYIDAALVEHYRFGTETADFHICRTCGVVPFVTSSIGGEVFAVVNVNSFDGVGAGELAASPTDFDGETVDSRLARRRRNWIPEVTIEAANG